MEKVKKAINILSEGGPIELSKRTCNYISGKLEPSEEIKYRLWERGVIGFDLMYDKEYYEKLSRNERVNDVEQLCDVIYSEYEPDSVIDFGCGPGVFLNQFYKMGVTVLGVDNSAEAFDVSPVPEENLIIHDLRQPYAVENKYDLTICIELLEHLSEEHADTLVSTIVESGEIMIVSAAYPGQGGQVHINEKPKDYWISKFESKGVIYDKNSSEYIINQVNLDALDFVEDTLMVFKQSDF